MKEPSDRQVVFAVWISKAIGKPLPTENTAQAYFLYIQDNIEQYKKLRAEKRKACVYNYHKLPRKHIYNSVMDDEQDASWATAMDFSWM
jgi:hypothetical protein